MSRSLAEPRIFVTGTGTGVGKTTVAAVIARTRRNEGQRVAVFKPVAPGLDEDLEADHAILRRAAMSSQSDAEISPYRFGVAALPHLAAEIEENSIDPAEMIRAARFAEGSSDGVVCEGVGGLMVPITPTYLVRDLAVDLGYPLVIVSSPGLGTINHTLLTIEAAQAVGLQVDAVVITPWPANPSRVEVSNRETIASRAGVPVLTLEQIDPGRPEAWPTLRTEDRNAPEVFRADG